jgi:peptide/nickel transport system permease protein
MNHPDEIQEQEGKSKGKIKESFKITRKGFMRIFKYTGIRIITILLTIGIGLYLTLYILNLGGFVDEIQKAQIAEAVGMMGYGGGFDDIPEEELDAYIENLIWQMEEARGLHEPLSIRTFRWWFDAITLNWGETQGNAWRNREPQSVKDVIFGRLPYTLLLVGAANVLLFFASLGTAMVLSSKQGKFWDRLLASLTPISSAPSWVHGVILLAIFALELRILPFKGMFDAAPPESTFLYVLQILKHMVLPVTAIILSVFFQGVYTWRTFFMVHSGEDYVELAKAKGLPDRMIRRRYLLRPTLPSVITSFTMLIITFWESAIALEILFQWPGIGALFLQSVYSFNRPVVVALVVMFAYLMGFSVILLDIIYAIIDPRVRIGGNGSSFKFHSMKKFNIIGKIKGLFTHRKEKPVWKVKREFEKLPDESANTVRETSKRKKTSLLKNLFRTIRSQIFKYPMAVIGLFLIVFLFGISIYTVIAIPYDEAVSYWASEGKFKTPRLARPAWTNFFRREKWPETLEFDSTKSTEGVTAKKERVILKEDMIDIRITFDFEYTADAFPQDLIIYYDSDYDKKDPFSTMIMLTPDGREIEIGNFRATDRLGFILTREDYGFQFKNEISAIQQVFGDPNTDYTKPMKGPYQLQVLTLVFEPDANVDVNGGVIGKVFGLFGTDNQRRDLTVAMLWGTPVALTFGIVGAALTTTTTILLAAISAWYGGILDEIIQRITEMNITIPALPIAVMVYILYSKSIWVILGVMILLYIFGNSLKEYRAMFMQFKESPYIEAAVAYGASDWRIIFKYMLPRIVQVMVPQLVISVPSFVFLEATLAYLGVITPYLPTWGKVINSALAKGVFWGNYFWLMEPVILVMVTGLAFAFVGFALDKILNPRLRNL